ncbi:PaaI family thioesterase [Ramlibacter henchirensis]|uniref:PaaI family thioesterase n=1 Tax=Ramlibacter henchirensis TaxID=204072 RepID=A0A4Z0C3C2_9BURK|nr:PaaI family thioesterase [Ramlibacter henchirensis]TFZ06066.1 PaaI family thioesterase [Ramlibacter henchirensis]
MPQDPDTSAQSARPPALDSARIQAVLEPLFPGTMGVKLLEASPDRIVGQMLVRPDLCTSGGILHGGAYMAFADTLGAVGTVVNMPQGKMTTTTDSSTKFTAGARVGTTVRGECVPLHRGRTTMVWQTSITNEAGKLCAVVTQTQLLMDARG